MSFIDLTNQKFGRLVVLKRANNSSDNRVMWECKCDCGNGCYVRAKDLINGKTQSCRCLHKEWLSNRFKKHGMSKLPLYNIWSSTKNRCYNKKCQDYKDYGARGIIICDEWLNNFQSFYDWAIANGYKEGLTIERINTNGNYNPNNCRWATNKEQQNNKRSNRLIEYKDKKQTISQWAEKLGIKYTTLYSRLNKLNWDIERALTTK